MSDTRPGIGRPAGPQRWSTGASPTHPEDELEGRVQPASRPRFDSSPVQSPSPDVASRRAEFDEPAPRRERCGGGLTAAVLIAAIVLGGTAGVTGALLVTPDSPVSAPVAGRQQSGTSGSSGGSAGTAPDAEDAAQRMLQSVVQVRTAGGSGSGFAIDDAGHVMTNHHVVDGSSSVRLVLPDGTSTDGRVVGSDEDSDIAVIEASGLTVPAADLGRSADLRIGEPVIAVGSPLGLNGTVTSGIISALERTSQRSAQPLVQTDASINPGNSGGPLVGLDGRVVGVNTSIATLGYSSGNIGIGFAVPIDDASQIADDLIRG